MERFERLQMTRPHLHLYALVDGWGYERLMEEPMEAMPGCIALFEGTPDAALGAAGPWLVDACEQPALRDRLMALQSRAPFLSWLFTEVPLHGLAQLLQLRLDVRMPDGNTALLRFYDPRVLKGLALTLTPAQREEFFGHIHEWHFVVDGQALRIGRTDD